MGIFIVSAVTGMRKPRTPDAVPWLLSANVKDYLYLQELVAMLWPLATMLYKETKVWNPYFIYCFNATLLIFALGLTVYAFLIMKAYKIAQWPKKDKKKKKKRSRKPSEMVPEIEMIR